MIQPTKPWPRPPSNRHELQRIVDRAKEDFMRGGYQPQKLSGHKICMTAGIILVIIGLAITAYGIICVLSKDRPVEKAPTADTRSEE